MNYSELEKSYKNAMTPNALEVMEDYFFHQKDIDSDKSYRELAIQYCIDNNLNFTSTSNSLHEMSKQIIKCTCPKCGNEMIRNHNSGGNSDTYHFSYDCSQCKITLSICVPWDMISIYNK